MGLFRKEVYARDDARLYGDVALASSLPMWSVTTIISVIFFGGAIAVAFGEYARKETVTGWLTPDKGMARIISPDLSVVDAVHVVEGENVKQGQALITLRHDIAANPSDEAGSRLAGAASLRLLEIDEQIAELENQISLYSTRHEGEMSILITEKNSITGEISALRQQKKTLAARVAAAQDLLDRYRALVDDDAASILEVDVQREVLLTLRQDRAALSRLITQREGALAILSARISAAPAEQATRYSEYRAALAELRLRRAELTQQTTTVLTSPLAGRVAALPVRVGGTVPAGVMQIAVIPADGKLQAELFAPTRAAGFVTTGQLVRIKLDAFPFRKFGPIQGNVRQVTKTVFAPSELPINIAASEPVYRILVDLQQYEVNAAGETFPLQPGMTLRADIIQEKTRLWKYALSPILNR